MMKPLFEDSVVGTFKRLIGYEWLVSISRPENKVPYCCAETVISQTRKQVERCVKAVPKKRKNKAKAAEQKVKDVAAGVVEGKDAKTAGKEEKKKSKMSKKQKEKDQQVNGVARKEVQFQNPMVKEEMALMEAQDLQDVDISIKVEVSGIQC